MLILKFQEGSQECLEDLFERYRDPIYGFFRRRVWPDGRAEELAQETWVAVIRGIVRYEPRALFRTYLYGIAFKLLTDERRRQARNKKTTTGREPSTGESVELAFQARDALEKLDVADREIIMLREYEQLSYSEIAELLRMPLNTVRTRLFRARIALKRLMEPETNSAAVEEA